MDATTILDTVTDDDVRGAAETLRSILGSGPDGLSPDREEARHIATLLLDSDIPATQLALLLDSASVVPDAQLVAARMIAAYAQQFGARY